MSSQNQNSAAYSGYVSGSTALGPVPLRDASDLTRQIREQIMYRENRPSGPIQPGDSEHKWIMFGNQFRLSYLYGKLKCGNCTGGTFMQNGAYNTVTNSTTYGGS
jgi:hypothetical protein